MVLERAEERVGKILQDHGPKPLDPDMEKEKVAQIMGMKVECLT